MRRTRPFLSRIFRALFSRKSFVRLVFAAALLATLIVAIHLVEGWRGRRAWAAYQADAERRGVKLTLADYVPPAVPDAENYAAIPIFEDVFRASKTPGTPVRNPFQLPEIGTDRSTSGVVEVPRASNTPVAKTLEGIKLPDPKADLARSIRMRSLGDMNKGELIDLSAWRDRFVETKLLDAPSDVPARDIVSALESYEPALQQLRDAGARRHSRFPVEWERGFGAHLPHLGLCQSATKLFALRTMALLALGESAAAYAEWSHGLRLYRALEQEPVLINGLVRISIVGLLDTAAWNGLAADQWAEPELRALQADYEGVRMLQDYVFALNSERGAANLIVDTAARSRANLAALWALAVTMTPPGSLSLGEQIGVTLYPRGWIRQNQVLMNEFYDEHFQQLDLGRGVQRPGTWEQQIEAISKSPFKRLLYYPTMVLLPVVFGVEKRYLFAHTRAQQVATACALERFRRARGAYPETLAALVPEFLTAVPVDVMDGAPLRYRQTSEGRFELWSVGMNRTDEQAAPHPKRGKGEREQPDWVWRYPAQ